MTSPSGIPADRCLVMGVVNVTPDSFSDGGLLAGVDHAVAYALSLHEAGADIVDIGGESTRPGAVRLSPSEEWARVGPVIAGAVAAGVTVSVDTMHADTAEAAVGAGAYMVNDVSGGLADPAMLPAVAEMDCPYIVMHWRGHSERMDQMTGYDDVVADVAGHLHARADAAVAAGVDPARIIIDPGLGFAKESADNWRLLNGMDELRALGLPVLIGASRKRFLGALLADADGRPRSVERRDAATAAVTVLAAAAGAWGVRVHDVAASADAVRVVQRYQQKGA